MLAAAKEKSADLKETAGEVMDRAEDKADAMKQAGEDIVKDAKDGAMDKADGMKDLYLLRNATRQPLTGAVQRHLQRQILGIFTLALMAD